MPTLLDVQKRNRGCLSLPQLKQTSAGRFFSSLFVRCFDTASPGQNPFLFYPIMQDTVQYFTSCIFSLLCTIQGFISWEVHPQTIVPVCVYVFILFLKDVKSFQDVSFSYKLQDVRLLTLSLSWWARYTPDRCVVFTPLLLCFKKGVQWEWHISVAEEIAQQQNRRKLLFFYCCLGGKDNHCLLPFFSAKTKKKIQGFGHCSLMLLTALSTKRLSPVSSPFTTLQAPRQSSGRTYLRELRGW